jgi:hypothetical protein
MLVEAVRGSWVVCSKTSSRRFSVGVARGEERRCAMISRATSRISSMSSPR